MIIDRTKAGRTLAYAVAVLFVADLSLLMSGYRILVRERRGEEWSEHMRYVPLEKLGDTLDCSYFTGRSVRTYHFGAYAAKPDECPFLFNPNKVSIDR